MKRRNLLIGGSLGGLAAAHSAFGQSTDSPGKPVRIIVPYAAGSATDALARLMAEKLSARWSQSVIIDNRPSAGGNLGLDLVANAAPDGATLLFMPGPFVHKALSPDLRADPEKLVPLSVAATGYSALVVHPGVPAQTVPELIAYAKAHPGRLNYASQGIGSIAHLAGELFKSMTGTEMVHVPYKGNAPAMTDLLGGRVDAMFLNLGSALPHVRTGKLKALGLGSEKRNAVIPELATISETVPGFVTMVWWGLFAPPGTPAPVADRISAAVHDVLRTPEIAKWMSTNTFEAIGGTPAEAAQLLRRDNERWVKVIRQAGIKAE